MLPRTAIFGPFASTETFALSSTRRRQALLLAYVDHHDDAYKWAERRRIETHPKTGAVQIVEVRERVEEIARPRAYQENLDLGHPAELQLSQPDKSEIQPFTALSREDLLSIGVPEDWLNDVLLATEDKFFDLADHLPAEASEALLEYVSRGTLNVLAPVVIPDPYAHPDSLRRIRVVENAAELEQALSFPWERWVVFLHPSQQAIVEQVFAGPARVSGSAGTGKGGCCRASRPRGCGKQPQFPGLACDLCRAVGLLLGAQTRNFGWRPIRGDSANHCCIFPRHCSGALSAGLCPSLPSPPWS